MRAEKIKNANVFISTWITITLAIVFIDLAIFILFAIDYGNLVKRSESVAIPTGETATLGAQDLTWLSAQNSAGIMMTIALRGYFLWVLNLALPIYFFVESFRIYAYNRKQVIYIKCDAE